MLLSYTMTTSSTSVLSVRVSAEERAILEAAAGQARTTLSDFVRRKAVEQAEIDVLDRRVITIPAEHWEEFESWLNRPAEVLPGLRDLARRRPTWET